jgi:hypothetical protein
VDAHRVQGRLAHDLNHLYRHDPGWLVGVSATGDDRDAYDPEQPWKREGFHDGSLFGGGFQKLP